MGMFETKVGFPDIDGYVMHNHIDCHYPAASIILWFHTHTPDLTAIKNIRVFLLGASMKGADVELNPFFPELKSYSVRQEVVYGAQKSLLNIIFEKGEISFLFEEVFHVISLHPMHVPAELKKRLVQK